MPEGVSEGETLPLGVPLPVALPLCVRLDDCVPLGVSLGDGEGEADGVAGGVPVGEALCDAVPLAVGESETVKRSTEGATDEEGRTLGTKEKDAESVRLLLGEGLVEDVNVCEGLVESTDEGASDEAAEG